MTATIATQPIVGLVKYDVDEAVLAATRERCETLTADTPKGYEEVRVAIAALRETRTGIEKKRVELKADALDYGRRVDSEAKRLTALIVDIEDPLKAKKAAIDDEKERVKREAEAEKLRALEAEIAANRAKQEAEAKAIRDAEAAKLAAERAALDAERARLAAVQVEIDKARQAEESRAAAARKVEQDRIDAERAKLDAERRSVEAERQKAERAEFERQATIRAEKEAAEKIARDRLEAAKRDAEIAALAPDLDKLRAFSAAIRLIQAPKLRSKKLTAVVIDAMASLCAVADTLETEATAAKGGRK